MEFLHLIKWESASVSLVIFLFRDFEMYSKLILQNCRPAKNFYTENFIKK